ncbi:lytic murein transglycosylase [Neoaquamicrobium sediminum]|uniref:lytic murein transglycosylase n=1 Tax=Neoaquamicrobium sediminum TaxID=1849104 RepID=UPI0015678031|nr:lytic murein transglycosylase [Mesorhizobium sediminum]NRC55536.1 lytic murein transglycosylase [Mesorhizobium sediminum]
MKTTLAALTLTLATAGPALAQQCGGDLSAWRAGVAQEAQAAGVGQRGLAALDNARIDERVLSRDRAQGVFTQTFTEFAGRMINSYRLEQGGSLLRRHADLFAKAERDYGVPGPVIAAFWALETDFGAVQGDFNTLNALVTLAHDCRRPELFRPQLVPMLTLIDNGTLPADSQGAWAGEIGQTQMLPSDILKLGVDGDGDGVVDMRKSVPDVILTTGRKIQSRGWRAGEPWMLEVQVPDELPWEETGRVNRLPISQWTEWGVTKRDGSPLDAGAPDAGLALPMGHKGPAFLVYPNFDVYLEWNQSFTYTLTAANLATRLAGAPRFDARSPEQGLTGDAMKLLQQKLLDRGHDVGGIDGILGAMTREAVRVEQQRLGLPVDGWPTPALLTNL